MGVVPVGGGVVLDRPGRRPRVAGGDHLMGPPSISGGRWTPCQCVVVSSSSSLVTFTVTRVALAHHQRRPPHLPHRCRRWSSLLAVEQRRRSTVPARGRSRVPSSSGGIHSALTASDPAGADVAEDARKRWGRCGVVVGSPSTVDDPAVRVALEPHAASVAVPAATKNSRRLIRLESVISSSCGRSM